MDYLKLGNSGMYVSKLVLGTLDFGSNVSEKESFRIMDRAIELGINFFDTSNSYGVTNDDKSQFGLSESTIGNWFQQDRSNREKVILNTKCYMSLKDDSIGVNDTEGLSAYKMRLQLEASLRRLQTDHVELYTMHKYKNDFNWSEIWNTYEYFFNSGKVFYAGASNFSAYAIARCQEEARKRKLLGLISEQNRYNLYCRQIEVEMLEALQKENISLLTWSPLFGGRLSSKVFNPPKTGRKIRNKPDEAMTKKLLEYQKLCKSFGFKEEEVALSWLMHHQNVCCVLLGANSVEELEENVRCLEIELPKELLEQLDLLFPSYPAAQDWYMN